MDNKITETSLGKFIMTRTDKAEEFVCDCCNKPKKSKNKITLVQEGYIDKIICNGCYGFLVAESKK